MQLMEDQMNRSIGIYKFSENIRNFSIRAFVRKTSTSTVIRNQIFAETSDVLDSSEELGTKQYVIGWQQKMFSREELAWYSEDRGYDKYLEKKYHEMIKQQLLEPNNLYTITEGDLSLSQKSEKATSRSKRATQLMCIMMEIEDWKEPAILCRLEVDVKRRLLFVSPDFNSSNDPYTAKGGSDFGSTSIEYAVEDASKQMAREERILKKHILDQLRSASVLLPNPLTSSVFHMPPTSWKATIFGEIASAENFESENLFVEYLFDLPKGWFVDSNPDQADPLRGYTQKCRVNSAGSAVFCAPFELSFYCEEEFEDNEQWPALCIRVGSSDFWERERSEGFGFQYIPSISGYHEIRIKTWKPAPINPMERLRDYFLGDSPQAETFSRQSDQYSLLSKFSQRTESSGQVSVNINIIKQSKSIVTTVDKRIFVSSISAESTSSISDVLSAFERAKQRMLNVMQSLRVKSNQD